VFPQFLIISLVHYAQTHNIKVDRLMFHTDPHVYKTAVNITGP